MTAHDERDVETVAEALRLADGVDGDPWHDEAARAVLDALDLPGRERRAKAEALTQAADSLSMLPPRIGAYVPTMADAIDGLRHRAAELDPEEADDE